MTIIYGLREVGSDEIRYVGLTNKSRAERLKDHQTKANTNGWNYGVSVWMRNCGRPVEIIQLCACSPDKARKAERRWVERLHKQGCRLVNSHLVPRNADARAEARSMSAPEWKLRWLASLIALRKAGYR